MIASFAYVDDDGVNDNALTINKPAGTEPGMLMIAFMSQGDTSSPVNFSSSGWTLLSSSIGYPNIHVLYKTAGGSEPSSYIFSTSRPIPDKGGIIVTCNSSSISASSGVSTSTTSTTVTTNPVNIPDDGISLAYFSRSFGGSPLSTPSGYSIIHEFTTGSGISTSWGLYQRSFQTAIASHSTSSTYVSTSGTAASCVVALIGN